MGKSKKRNLNKISEKNSVVLKRVEIVKRIISDIHNRNINDDTLKYINLFGITQEELSEAGALYEELSAVKHLFL